MKTNFTSFSVIALTLTFGASMSALAQADSRIAQHSVTIVIPTVALLDIETSEPSANFDATFVAPTEAGEKIEVPDDNSTLWLNYSSIQTLEVTKRVDVETSAVVPGVDVNVLAGASATGSGTQGTPAAAFNLTVAPKKLIDGIGSAYTTSGPNKGHQLTYSFISADANYADIRSGNTTVTVKYTLADN